MENNERAIGPVIGMALFIVAAVVAVVAFQIWFQDYSTRIFTDVEASEFDFDLNVERIRGETLYLRYEGEESVNISDVVLEKNSCEFGETLEEGLNRVSLLDCLEKGMEGNVEVGIELEDELITRTIYMGDDEPFEPEIDLLSYNLGNVGEFPLNITYYANMTDYTELLCDLDFGDSGATFDCTDRYFEEKDELNREDLDGTLRTSLRVDNEYEKNTSEDQIVSVGNYIYDNEGWNNYESLGNLNIGDDKLVSTGNGERISKSLDLSSVNNYGESYIEWSGGVEESKVEAFSRVDQEYTWEVPEDVEEVSVLVVGGGGGGGGNLESNSSFGHGGGGAGGLVYVENYDISDEEEITIDIGDGGDGGDGERGQDGENTYFGDIIALGGGGGGSAQVEGGMEGSDGGSGGGATGSGNEERDGGSSIQSGESGVSGEKGQGNDGGQSPVAFQPNNNEEYRGGAGGGGAGEEGEPIRSYDERGYDGGTGEYFGDIFGNQYGEDSGWFAGGGGGGIAQDSFNPGEGGRGGGGDGSAYGEGNDAESSTGGGGGGAAYQEGPGGDGGSGIVLVKYQVEKDHESEIFNDLVDIYYSVGNQDSAGDNWYEVENGGELSELENKEFEGEDKYLYTRIDLVSETLATPYLDEKFTVFFNQQE